MRGTKLSATVLINRVSVYLSSMIENTYVATNGGMHNFVAPRARTAIGRTGASSVPLDSALFHDMVVHHLVDIPAEGNRDRSIAEGAARCDSIGNCRIVLGTFVFAWLEVVRAERLGTEVAFDRQKVVEAAARERTGAANKQQLSIGAAFTCGHGWREHCV